MKNWCFILVILFVCASPVAAQTTVTVSASADNTVYQNPATSSNALGPNIFSGTNGGGSPRRGLIRFDLAAAVPANATIMAVTLTLNCNTSRSVADDVSLHKLLAAWGEGTSNAGTSGDGSGAAATTNDATWTTRFFPGTAWANAGGDFTAAASASTSINNTGFYQWSSSAMVADVQSWVPAPASNFGWALLCNEGAISTARKFGSRENSVAANRPSLSITYTATLPVTLTHFRAAQQNGRVSLSWATSQEVNNHFFEILHSCNGIGFSSVGRVAGSGTSSTKKEYGFSHDVTAPGNHFYRLAQVDFDGKRKHSAVERVYVPAFAGDLTVVPNPVLNKFTVSSVYDLRNATYKIFGLNGTIALAGKLVGRDVGADGLATGIYHLCVYVNNKIIGRAVFIKC